jgi:hypothetical protein
LSGVSPHPTSISKKEGTGRSKRLIPSFFHLLYKLKFPVFEDIIDSLIDRLCYLVKHTLAAVHFLPAEQAGQADREAAVMLDHAGILVRIVSFDRGDNEIAGVVAQGGNLLHHPPAGEGELHNTLLLTLAGIILKNEIRRVAIINEEAVDRFVELPGQVIGLAGFGQELVRVDDSQPDAWLNKSSNRAEETRSTAARSPP